MCLLGCNELAGGAILAGGGVGAGGGLNRSAIVGAPLAPAVKGGRNRSGGSAAEAAAGPGARE